MENKRRHFMYGAWAAMWNRCTNPNNRSFTYYGAKGITVCDRWKQFENFLSDMGERPPGMTLDRIDTYGPYSPENCRWATPSEQRRNRTKEGDDNTRLGMRRFASERWAEWKAAGNVPKPKHPPIPRSQHRRSCATCGREFVCVRSDARFCSSPCRDKRRALHGAWPLDNSALHE